MFIGSAERRLWKPACMSPKTARQCARATVPITEEVALDLPFGNLLHFRKDVDTQQPKVLVTAPLSGHFATLLAGTVQTLLQHHDVYISDRKNARDVPREAGLFGVEDYVAYVIRFMEEIGPGGHILGVCQPCVQALAAVAVVSEDRPPPDPAQHDPHGRACGCARKPYHGE